MINEINSCKRVFPNEYIRVVGYDADKQVQSAGFLVTRPGRPLAPEQRSVGGQSYGGGGGAPRQAASWDAPPQRDSRSSQSWDAPRQAEPQRQQQNYNQGGSYSW